MNLTEMQAFCESRIQSIQGFMASSEVHQNVWLWTSNVNALFEEHLMLGLLNWRQNLDPRRHLTAAVHLTLEAFSMLPSIGSVREHLSLLPIERSIYLASLLNIPHPALELSLLSPKMHGEAFIGNVISGNDKIEDWPIHQEQLAKTSRLQVARETLATYILLLKDQDSLQANLEKAEMLYGRRENDAYYSGGHPTEGGSDFNPLVVDYRLGAILKKIGSTVPTVHAWRW